MKGKSSIKTMILILMIVIALAALAYTWFPKLAAYLTSKSSEMTTQFRIDTAKSNGIKSPNMNLIIRNTGNTNIDLSNMSAYTNDQPCTITPPSPAIIPPDTNSSFIGLVNCLPCTTCSNNACYLPNGNVETLTVTIGSGLQQIATVTC